MANRKISEFTALTAPAATDVFAIIDQSESGADKNKKIAYSDVLSKAPDGSAGTPAFSFNSDPNSGISGGSDTLVLSTGGTAAISVDSSQNVTLSANLTVSGTTTTIDTTTLTVKDKNIEIAKGNGNDAAVDGAGITIDSTEGDKTWNWVDSTDAWTSSEHIDLASGKVLKVAGTQVLSATNFTGTSAVATAVTVADESSDTSCNVLFTTAATGNLAPKSGTNLTFNSDTGVLTATGFAGALTGNVTGNCSGTAATVTGAAQSNITSVGTLSSLASGAITTTDNLSVDNAKEVRLYEADSNGSAYVGIKSPDDKGSEASYTISLPAASPTANQILKADASTPTNLTWATDSGGIPDTGGTFTGKVTHNYTSSLRVPVGTTGQRDGSPSNGDFRYNSTNSKFEGYQGGSWGEIGGGATGSADLLDIASSSGTGGGGSTFDGSRYRFKLVTKGTSDAVTPTNAEILRVSINGVIQQPNDGTGQGDMTEGYVVSGTDIIFDSAPPSGASYFIINMGTTIAVGTPGDTTVTEAKLNVSNGPTNGYFLQAQSGAAGGLTWAEVTTTPTTTRGDIIYRGASADQRLAKGTSGQFLKIGANDPEWADVVGAVADGCIYENSQTISNNYTIAVNKGAHSVGPITISATVTNNGVWVIS